MPGVATLWQICTHSVVFFVFILSWQCAPWTITHTYKHLQIHGYAQIQICMNNFCQLTQNTTAWYRSCYSTALKIVFVCVSVYFILAVCAQGKYTNTDRGRIHKCTQHTHLHKCAVSCVVCLFLLADRVHKASTHTRLGWTQVRRIFWTLVLSGINIKHETKCLIFLSITLTQKLWW